MSHTENHNGNKKILGEYWEIKQQNILNIVHEAKKKLPRGNFMALNICIKKIIGSKSIT